MYFGANSTLTVTVHDLQKIISMLEEGRAEQASVLLEQVLAELPEHLTARILLARAYEARQAWGRALPLWRQVLLDVPNSPVAQKGLRRAQEKLALGERRRRDAEVEPEEHPAEGLRTRPGIPWIGAHVWSGPEGTEEAEAELDTPLEGIPAEDFPEGNVLPDGIRQEVDLPADAGWEEEPEDAAPEAPRPGAGEDIEARPRPPYEDLDRLIDELESARIVPRPDLESVPEPDLEDDIEDVVSETLAKIYASQGQFDEAARVYELMAGQRPEKAEEYFQKASEMRSRASD